MIDKIVSHYKIISQLGQGGMGVLYLAEDLQLNRKAVLKFLPPDVMNDPDVNLRFKREAQAAGSLSHPNIVTIYDVGVHENKTFIAMEYVEGKTLRELIKSDELTIERITDISVQICEGLNEAHSKGITHRDIKPENILIDEKGKVKIVDFGLAKIKNTSRGITKQDTTVGTIKYMSPEQIRNQSVDHRSDIWSFGVILYEMITGKYPFKGEHDASIFYSVINQTPEPLARYKANIGEGFQRIIDKSLDKDTVTRYQHIDELLSDIRREKKESGEYRVTKKRTNKSKSKIAIIIATVALIILSAVVINYLLNSPIKKIPPPRHTQLTFIGNIYFYENGPLFDRSQISPDGEFTAYVTGEGNEKSIFIKDNSGDRAIEIFKGVKWVTSLRWSPDGNKIFFSSINNNSSSSSYIIPKLGGKVQELKFIQFGCWSPDESLIAGVHSSYKSIILVKRETDEIVKSLELKGDFNWLNDIDWSPSGDKILFLTRNDSSKIAIWTIETDGTHQQRILEETNGIYSPRWSSDGNYIYYLQSNGMTNDLMKTEISSIIDGKKSQVIQTGLQAYGFSITTDNKKLSYTKHNVSANLWCFTQNSSDNLFQSKKITSGTSYYGMPALSLDGKQIAFTYNGNIFTMSVDGDSINQLTFLNSSCRSPTWSPNKEEIAFLTGSNLAKVFAKGGAPTIFKNTVAGGRAFWASDSEIFYQDSRNRNICRFNLFTNQSKLLVSNDSVGWMFGPQQSPDSLNIAVYWNGPEVGKGLWLISQKDSLQKLIYKGMIYPLRWSRDSNSIYALNFEKIPPEILMVSSNSGATKFIYTLPIAKATGGFDLDITPDGKTIVCAIQETNSDVWMIENFDPDVE